MYKRILVATDGSPLSKKATRDAIGLSQSLGASLVVLNVVARYPMSFLEGGASASVSLKEIGLIEDQWAAQGQSVADAVQKSAEAAGVKAKAVVTRSNLVAAAILAAARKNKCDLIVMASHGRKGIARILLGSETQHVLTHSAIPVLVLR